MNWAIAEPQQGQYNWAPSDALVSRAARSGIDLLPIVIYAPEWARQHPDQGASVPKNPADYAVERFRSHAHRFRRAAALARDGDATEDLVELQSLEHADNPFADASLKDFES